LPQQFDAIGNAPPTPSPEPVEETVENNEGENENQNEDGQLNSEESNQTPVDSALAQENPSNLENHNEIIEDISIQDTQKHHDDDEDVIVPAGNKKPEENGEDNKENS
jgi:hypothetical protein